jgi:hypothetical protein
VLSGSAAGLGAGLLWPVGAQADPPPIDDRYVLRARSAINVKDYGAVGNSSTDDLAAIQSAIAAIPSTGGTLLFPHGDYACSGTLTFDNKHAVVLVGEGGLSGGTTPASQLHYTGSGARFISARTTAGFTIRDLAVSYSQSSFTGALIDLSAPSGVTQGARIERALIGTGGPALRSARLLDLDKAVSSSFDSVAFSGGDVAVRGKAAGDSFSNVISFRSCMFVFQQTVHVKNAGQAWEFDGCTFEPLHPGASAGGAGAYAQDSGMSANALSFRSCWFGDADATGTWIRFSGAGLSVRHCYISRGLRGVLVEGPSTVGVDISANSFDTMPTGVEFVGINNGDVVVLANAWNVVPNQIVYGASLLNAIVQCDVPGYRFNDVMHGMRMAGGVPLDSYWQVPPPDGTFYLDTTAHRLYIRDGGIWRHVALT